MIIQKSLKHSKVLPFRNDCCKSVPWMIYENSEVILDNTVWIRCLSCLTYSSVTTALLNASSSCLSLCLLTVLALLLVSTGMVKPMTVWIGLPTPSAMPTSPCQEWTDWWGTDTHWIILKLCSISRKTHQSLTISVTYSEVALCDPVAHDKWAYKANVCL